MSSDTERYDVVVVGAGIVGLAHALAAARAGRRVLVVDREAAAVGASIRNFGFVTVTGQQRGLIWHRARRSREVWQEVVDATGLEVHQHGLAVIARIPEGRTVLEELLRTEMGEGCSLVEGSAMRDVLPMLRASDVQGVLWSPHEMRVEPRVAIPAVAAWLATAWGVTFRRCTAVRRVERRDDDTVAVELTDGTVLAEHVAVCPGPDLRTLFPDVIARHRTTHCKLHMMRIAPQPAGWRLPGAVMTDLSILRYEGYSELSSAPPAKDRLRAEHPELVENGVHLIVVQASDGSLVVGDSHHYGESPEPFQPAHVDDLILEQLHAVLDVPVPTVTERWLGIYPWSPTTGSFVERPDDRIRVSLVTSGAGMSTSFAFGEEVMRELLCD